MRIAFTGDHCDMKIPMTISNATTHQPNLIDQDQGLSAKESARTAASRKNGRASNPDLRIPRRRFAKLQYEFVRVAAKFGGENRFGVIVVVIRQRIAAILQ